MRANLNVQMAKAKTQSATTWSGSELVCFAVQRGKNTELCGDDHAPVTRGRMRAQYPLPHGKKKSSKIDVFGLVLVWLGVASVCWFGPRTHSTFFFYMDPLSNGWGLSKVGPSMGPYR